MFGVKIAIEIDHAYEAANFFLRAVFFYVEDSLNLFRLRLDSITSDEKSKVSNS
jgi:hypothetical protein